MRRRSTISSLAVAFDLQADGVALAAVVQLGADAFEDGARLFLLHVEVAVAGDAEGGAAEDLVAAVHALDLGLDEVVEQDEVGAAGRRWAEGRGAAASGAR